MNILSTKYFRIFDLSQNISDILFIDIRSGTPRQDFYSRGDFFKKYYIKYNKYVLYINTLFFNSHNFDKRLL